MVLLVERLCHEDYAPAQGCVVQDCIRIAYPLLRLLYRDREKTLDKRLRIICVMRMWHTMVSFILLKRAILVGDRVIFCDRNARDYGRPLGIQITGKSLDATANDEISLLTALLLKDI